MPYIWATMVHNGCAMALPPVAPELAARLANYTIDDRARVMLRELAPLLEPHLGTALDEVIAGAARLPQVAEIYGKHSAEFRRIEIAQFRELLQAEFGPHYLECCRNTVEQETALGFEGRARMNAAAAVLRVAVAVLAAQASLLACHARRPRPRAVAGDLLRSSPPPRRSICSACERPTSARRKVIDEAIGEFDGAIGGVIEALKEATGSLTATSSTDAARSPKTRCAAWRRRRRRRRRPARASI